MKGYIRKRGTSYRVEIHVGYDANGKRIRHSETLGNKKAAEKYLRQKLDELETEGNIRAKHVETLGDFIGRWLEVCAKPNVRLRTFQDYTEVVERHLTDKPLSRLALAAVTPADIQEHYSGMLEGGRGTHPVRKLHCVIRQALQQAVLWRQMPANPALSVSLPKIKRPDRTERILSAQDFPKFVASALAEPRLGSMWVVALATGLRPAELLGLMWSDFSESLRKVRIQRTLVRPMKVRPGHAPWRFEPTKTEAGVRTLALESEVVFLLKQHKAQQAEERLAAGDAWENHGLVFTNEIGGALHANNLRNRVLKRILKRAGLPEKIHLYGLRHSAATALLKDRESLKIVSSMLGHSRVELTANIYQHVEDDMLEEAASKLSKRLFG